MCLQGADADVVVYNTHVHFYGMDLLEGWWDVRGEDETDIWGVYLAYGLLQVVSPDVDVSQSRAGFHSPSQQQQTLWCDVVSAHRQPAQSAGWWQQVKIKGLKKDEAKTVYFTKLSLFAALLFTSLGL